ncbi:DUF3151 family protein [Streptomyces olivaceus]|nr:DUF3151 family protein [Streptomyces olivaceus]MBZ6178603.1 DUF3151 family protein [Streptomyces olivaceus]
MFPVHSVEQILARSTTHSRSRSGSWAARLSSHSCSVIQSPSRSQVHLPPFSWEHEPNRGFLCALHALARAAREIGEKEEYERCSGFLKDSSPSAAEVLG